MTTIETGRDQPTAAIREEATRFAEGFDTLILATVGADGWPQASAAVHIRDAAGCFIILVSELATHTRNLMADPRAGVLFIEDEKVAKTPLARRRLAYQCRVSAISRAAEEGDDAMARLIDKHGEALRLVQGLADFHLFRLTPERAAYVRGFGQAYAWNQTHDESHDPPPR